MVYAIENKVASFLYSLLSTSYILFRLPWWILISIPRSARPRPSNSFGKALAVRVLHVLIEHNDWVVRYQGSPNHQVLELGKDALGLWIEPEPTILVGDVEKWAHNARMKPIRIPGYWIHSNQMNDGAGATMGERPSAEERCFLFFHGGGYMTDSSHPHARSAGLARTLLDHCSKSSAGDTKIWRIFKVEYRLTTGPPLDANGTFPAALIDAIMGYNYLVNTVGFLPSQIILAGDSAGGHLVLSLARYLVENASALPSSFGKPSGLLVFSPWVNLGPEVISGPSSSYIRNADSDMLHRPSETALNWSARSFAGPLGSDGLLNNPYISPASPNLDESAFRGFPKTFINAGGAEILLDDIKVLKDRMQKAIGEGNVVYYEGKDAIHAYVHFPFEEPEVSNTFKAIIRWLGTL